MNCTYVFRHKLLGIRAGIFPAAAKKVNPFRIPPSFVYVLLIFVLLDKLLAIRVV